jgi:hypothetical protein
MRGDMLEHSFHYSTTPPSSRWAERGVSCTVRNFGPEKDKGC